MKDITFHEGDIVKSLNPIYQGNNYKYLIGIVVKSEYDNDQRLIKFYEVMWLNNKNIETVAGHDLKHI
jgi:hypothetical protein